MSSLYGRLPAGWCAALRQDFCQLVGGRPGIIAPPRLKTRATITRGFPRRDVRTCSRPRAEDAGHESVVFRQEARGTGHLQDANCHARLAGPLRPLPFSRKEQSRGRCRELFLAWSWIPAFCCRLSLSPESSQTTEAQQCPRSWFRHKSHVKFGIGKRIIKQIQISNLIAHEQAAR